MGPLSRMALAVYRVILLELSLVLTCGPTLLAVILLERDPSNVPLYALAMVPVAPALSAGLYAIRAWPSSDEFAPARPFWRGYRLNVIDVLRWWVPALVAATVLGVTIANSGTVQTAATFTPVAVVLMVALALLCGHMLLITAYFDFRTRDVWRIAIVESARSLRTTLSNLSLLVVSVGILYISGEVMLLLLAWLLLMLLRMGAGTLLTHVNERYVAHD